MILATLVTLAGLSLVVVLLVSEPPPVFPDRLRRAAGPRPQAPPVEELATAPLPRALLGYEPAAVRRLVTTLAAAYTELAREVDDETVRAAWARAHGGPDGERGGEPPGATDATPVASDTGRTGGGEVGDEGVGSDE